MFSTQTREFAGKKSVWAGARPKAESTEPRQQNPLWQQLATRIQPKFAVSAPDDPHEREADQVADQVMRMSAPIVQRSCAACAAGSPPCPECEEEQKEKRPAIHRKAHDSGEGAGSSVSDEFLAGLGSGQPLHQATRSFMEPRFGRGFEAVRIHTQPEAAESARAMNALAYTLGSHVVFGKGQYAPESGRGRRLLAHELTHVVQQGNSPAGVSMGQPPGAYPERSVRHFSPSPMVQRTPITGDPIHDPLIAQFRRDHGLPPNGIDPATGDRVGPSDGEIKYGDEYERWLRKGNVSAPASAPSLSPVAPPLNASQCGMVQPGMPQAQADQIRSCITHARYVGFLAQSISNIAQVSSPYAPALAQLYRQTMQQVVSAGMANPPSLGASRDFSINNVNVTISGDTLPVSSFTLRLQQLRTNSPVAIANGAYSPVIGGVALTEDSDSAVTNNQPDIERTIYHEGIHLLSALVSQANSVARRAPGGGRLIHRELDAQLTSSYQTRFLNAVAPIWRDALAQVSASPSSIFPSTPTTTQLGIAQWLRFENEIISRVEEAVYLALRAGRGFTISDLQALPQLWLATPAYWDTATHFDATAFGRFLAGKVSTINSDVLPLIQEIQKEYLYLRPTA